MDDRAIWAAEWQRLQSDHERFELAALALKALALAAVLLGALWAFDPIVLALVLALLWLQEAIARTSQARLASRLLDVEAALAGSAPAQAAPMQLHSRWLAARPGFGGLLSEYLGHALRPTVAFPHLPLLLIVAWVTSAG